MRSESCQTISNSLFVSSKKQTSPAKIHQTFFEPSQSIVANLSKQIEAINIHASMLSQWQNSINTTLNALQPILSIVRNALARSQSDMISDKGNGGIAQLSPQEYRQINKFFEKNPQTIVGFSSGTYWHSFPKNSLETDLYSYTEKDLMSLNASLQRTSDLFSDQVNTLQVIFQMMNQSFGSDLNLTLNFLDYSNSTFKTMFSQFV